VDYGKRVSCTLPRNGDLVTTLFLEVVLTKHASNASYYPAEQFVKECDIEIGGQKVDKIYNDSMRIFSELYHTKSEKEGYRRLVDFADPAAGGHPGSKERFFVPIQFWFSRGASGLALPLVALQYHEVRVNFLFASSTEMALNGVDTTVTPEATLFATYVYLVRILLTSRKMHRQVLTDEPYLLCPPTPYTAGLCREEALFPELARVLDQCSSAHWPRVDRAGNHQQDVELQVCF